MTKRNSATQVGCRYSTNAGPRGIATVIFLPYIFLPIIGYRLFQGQENRGQDHLVSATFGEAATTTNEQPPTVLSQNCRRIALSHLVFHRFRTRRRDDGQALTATEPFAEALKHDEENGHEEHGQDRGRDHATEHGRSQAR